MSADPDALIDFLSAAFGAGLPRRFNRPDGALAHAEVQINDFVAQTFLSAACSLDIN